MSRALFHRVVICLGLSLVAGFASATFADSETRRVGNTDGKPFVTACPDGQAVVGYAYNSGDQLMAIAAMCSKIGDNGHTSGVVTTAPALKGAEGGSGRDPIDCDPGQAVQRLDVVMTTDSGIRSFRSICHGPGTAPTRITTTKTDGGGADGSKMIADCKTDNYATAIVGTYSTRLGIQSIGLRCRAVGETAEAKPANGGGDNEQANAGGDDDNEAANAGGGENEAANAGGGDDADQAHGQDNGQDNGGFKLDLKIGPDGLQIGGGGGGGGKKGSKRVAQEPTTIYAQPAGKEIAYIERGDTVTIVRCEDGGEGWCQISRPTKGFVWGGDFD